MVRTILIGLDGSNDSRTALRLGIQWSRQTSAMLVGLGVVDAPTIARAETVLTGGFSHDDSVMTQGRMADARRNVEQFLEQFTLECAGAGVPAKVLEDTGLPADEIVLEAQRYDLVLLGRSTRFHFMTHEDRDDTLPKVLKNSPRPVVVVPSVWHDGGPVLIAYDGSLQAARALAQFTGMELPQGGPIQVLSVDTDRMRAARIAERAVDYLRFHKIHVQAVPIVTGRTTSEVLLEQISLRNAGLVVLGAYGQPSLREFVLGSVTRTLLEESPAPLFLSH